ncbi:DNA translocase FtsK, partial [Enterovirga sp.]|uniref:DNA translocase FtsK n=2 Tax=Enterovirga sp. TaxID=2026350 RepID=UPI002BE340AF
MRPTTKRPIVIENQEVESTTANVAFLAKQGRSSLSQAEGTKMRPVTTPVFDPQAQPSQPADVPPWFTAFDLAANTRFTRTPDHVRRRQAGELAAIAPLRPPAAGSDMTAEPAPRHDRRLDEASEDRDGPPASQGIDAPRGHPGDLPEAILADEPDPWFDQGEAEPEESDEDDIAEFVASLTGPPRLPFLGYGAVTLTAQLTWRSMRRPRDRSRPHPVEQDERPDDELPPPDRAPSCGSAAVAIPAPAPCRAECEEYSLPPLDLLAEAMIGEPTYEASAEYLDRSSVTLQQTLHDFGVRGEVIDANPGPVVTLYEFEPAPGTKASRVIGLSNDVARSMSAVSARIAVVPGRNVIGIELPNQKRETVFLREL